MNASEPSLPHLLYRDHHEWLIAWLRRRLGCHETAADLAQDTFLRLLCRQPDPDIRKPRHFLANVAHGLMVDHLRRRDLERAYLEAMAAWPPAHAPGEDERNAHIEALLRVEALLDGLAARPREVLLLSRLEGWSHPQIARRLDVSLSTVEKDMARALRHCYSAWLST